MLDHILARLAHSHLNFSAFIGNTAQNIYLFIRFYI